MFIKVCNLMTLSKQALQRCQLALAEGKIYLPGTKRKSRLHTDEQHK